VATVSHVQAGPSPRERTEQSARADVVFDPFLNLAATSTLAVPPILTASLEAPSVSGPLVAPVKDGINDISDLNPTHQAMLKMMASPPRGQDPLGIVTQVQTELQEGATAAKGADTAVRAAMPKGDGMPQRDEDHGSAAFTDKIAPFTGSEQKAASQVESVHVAKSAAGSGGAGPQPSSQPMGGAVPASALALKLSTSVVVAAVKSVDQALVPVAVGQVESAGAKPTGTLTAVAISGVKGNLSTRGSRVEVGGGAPSQARDEAADVEKVQAQALRGLAAALRKKGDAVTVVLRPEALGKIRIDLKFAESGVQGMLRCSSESARELLSNQVDGLTRAMESRGIVVDRLEVVHDPKIDPSPGMWDAAGARQHDQSGQDGGAGGTSDQHSGGAEGSLDQSGESEQEVDVIIHDPAFSWDGSRMALSTLA